MNKAYCVKFTRPDGTVAACNMNDLDLGQFQITMNKAKAEHTVEHMNETFFPNHYEVVEFEF